MFWILWFLQVKEDYPHLVGPNTDVSRKLGFPDVIMPGELFIILLLSHGILFKEMFNISFVFSHYSWKPE